MAQSDYSSAARTLASQIEDEGDATILPVSHGRRSTSPIWSRRSLDSNRPGDRDRPRTIWQKYMRRAAKLQSNLVGTWRHFTPIQQAGIVLLNIVLLVLAILFLVFHSRILKSLGAAAQSWRDLPGGWMILWTLTFVVSFPPLIGYSMLLTVSGFVYGMRGWFIMATASVIGSTCSFIASRSLLKGVASRITSKNKQFAALALVLKHDGLKLLCMIRLCPLPYSIANGAISTIPTVTWPNFMLATAVATPKLLPLIFVGSQMGKLAEDEKMNVKTQIISWISMAIGIGLGVGTGFLIYERTKARAKVLEAEEAAAAVDGQRSDDPGSDYIDDPDEQEAVNILRRDDDISLHQTFEQGGNLESAAYRDEYTDDEDAEERDVFDLGDDDEEEQGEARKQNGK